MSRYGKIPIPVPKGVEFKQVGRKVVVKGPKGELSLELVTGIEVALKEGVISVSASDQIENYKALHGLHRSLINNMVIGVSVGFQKRLNLVGVGYRAALAGKNLDLQLGFSHPTMVEIPQSIKVEVDKSTTIIVQGIDKQVVGQFAATVRAMKPPEPYKGKGIRYEDEYVRKKAGKAAKGK